MTEISYRYHPLWSVINRGNPYEPFDWQVQHLHSKVEYGFKRIILACGRRSGKSFGVKAEVAREVAQEPVVIRGETHAPLIYIGGPTAEAAERVWEPVWAMFVPPESGDYIPPLGFMYKSHDKSRGLIELKNGARIYKKTADNPVSWQGERVTLVVMDEAQDINEDVWQNVMPALLDSGGRLIAIGITKGKGRFRSYWTRGQGSDENFYSASVPTAANPVIKDMAKQAGKTVEEFIRSEAEADLTEDEFARQYLAEWREEEGSVFTRYERLFTAKESPPKVLPGQNIMSLDLGKLHDYTVAYVGNLDTSSVIAKLRFNKINYMDQVPQIVQMYNEYNCEYIHMDASGIGEAVAEQLRDAGCYVVPFKFTNESKQALISSMVRQVEKGAVRFLANDEDLKKEMGLFMGSISPGGVIKYEAMPGYFDDCVISAALLIQKMAKTQNSGPSVRTKSYMKRKVAA